MMPMLFKTCGYKDKLKKEIDFHFILNYINMIKFNNKIEFYFIITYVININFKNLMK